MKLINLRIAEELGVREQQVAAAISLLDGGATVPAGSRAGRGTKRERLSYLQRLLGWPTR
jgi:hypothetical protein